MMKSIRQDWLSNIRNDLLIMGACGHSPLRSRLFGCKINAMLGSVGIPVLLLR